MANNKDWYQKNRERLLAKAKLRRTNNPGYMKQWRAENKEHISAQYKKWREANKEKKLQQARGWRKANPEKVKAGGKKWRKLNPEKVAQQTRERRASKKAVGVEAFTRAEIIVRDGGRCQHCKKKVKTSGSKHDPLYAALDHIVALSKGGPTTRENIQLLCNQCNHKKSNRAVGDQLWLIG